MLLILLAACSGTAVPEPSSEPTAEPPAASDPTDGRVYWPDMGVNEIGDMEPGKGYQIYMYDPADLIYPDNS